MPRQQYDYVVVGAGIVGLAVARELLERRMGTVAVLEKEAALGLHGSGRNSGVLHAGIYYGTDSLRAKVCAEGSRRMQDFAAEHGVSCRRTGKVIVATSPETARQIDVLLERGRKNGIRVRKIDPEELREIEPEAVTHGAALHSPDTAVIDSTALLREVRADLKRRGGHLLLGTEITRVNPAARTVRTRRGSIGFGFLVNAAGLHADRVARWAGLDHDYQILPFKGLFRALSMAAAARIRGSIYPAPDLRLPFLGLHITPGAGGEVLVGPTAIPALGRENYGWLDGMDPIEGVKMVTALGKMLVHDQQGIRALVRAEMRRYPSEGFLAEARKLAPGLQAEDIGGIEKVGLRAQLVHRRSKTLVTDFVLEKGPSSLHVLNAISPAFTSAFRLAELIVDRI